MSNPRNEHGLDRRAVLTALAGAAGLGASAAQAAQPTSLPGPWTRTGFVDRGVGRIHYAVLGEGEPVVLMHKLGGWLADWRGIAPLLAKGRQVIALDLPGHGDSTMIGPPPRVWTPAESAAMVKAALDEIGVRRFSIVGNSLGGCVGIVLAARWPEAVKSLSLLSVSLASAMTQEQTTAQDAAIRSQYGPNWEPLQRSPEQTQQFGSIDPRINEEQNLSRPKAGVWVRPSERGVGLAGIDAHLPMIAAPTLVMFADRGTYTKFEPVARAKIRNLRIEKIADVGSFFHQEKPAQTAAVLNRFLDQA